MKTQLEFKKYKVGLPVISQSYHDKTPSKLKIIGETCSAVAAAITVIAGAATLPGWVVITGGLLSIAGRHIAKMFSVK